MHAIIQVVDSPAPLLLYPGEAAVGGTLLKLCSHRVALPRGVTNSSNFSACTEEFMKVWCKPLCTVGVTLIELCILAFSCIKRRIIMTIIILLGLFQDSKLHWRSMCSIDSRGFDDNDDYDQGNHCHQAFTWILAQSQLWRPGRGWKPWFPFSMLLRVWTEGVGHNISALVCFCVGSVW